MDPIPQPGMRQKAAKGWFIAFWAVFLPGIVISAILALRIVVSDANEPLFPEILLAAIPGFILAMGGYFVYRGLRVDAVPAKVLLAIGAGAVYWYVVDMVWPLLTPY